MASMTDVRLNGSGQLAKGFVMAVRDKDRVVAETVAAAWFIGNNAIADTIRDAENVAARPCQCHTANKLSSSIVRSARRQLVQQQLDLTWEIDITAITCRKDAGPAVECGDRKTRIVGQRLQSGLIGIISSFQDGVRFKGRPRLCDGLDRRKRVERNEFDRHAGHQICDLDQFAFISRCQNYLFRHSLSNFAAASFPPADAHHAVPS